MGDVTEAASRSVEHGGGILTPDQRLRVFISADLGELSDERDAVARAVRSLRLSPVLLNAGARPYPPRDVYRSYLRHSHIFVAVYGSTYGWIPPGEAVSVLEDQYELAEGMPRLVYVKAGAHPDPDLKALLTRLKGRGDLSYRSFGDAEELEGLVADDLAVLLTERFEAPLRATEPTVERPVVPVTPTTFVGRDAELDRAVALLRDPHVRLVTIAGPGGVGKTRLALELGRRTVDEFPDGAVILWLDGMRDPGFLLPALGAELQIKETGDDSLMTALRNRLRGTRMLVILDNFEHVMAAASTLADVVALPSASKFLVTSRELLRIRGEHAITLEPLPVPHAGDSSAAAVTQAPAVRLFVDRAQAAAPGFALSDDNAADVAELVRHLEGLPLALELAAARVRMLPPAALLQRLHSRLDLPGVAGRDLPQRQRTLRSMIDWSYQLLDDDEQRALEHLSVFAGGASLEGALYVLEGLAADPLPLLESLVAKSLVRRTEDDRGEPRLRLLAAIREFAGERLRERGDDDRARRRHAEHITALAADTAARLHSEDQVACLKTFDRELENLQVALEWWWDHGDADQAMWLATDLRWYWYMRGHLSAAAAWLERLLAMTGGSDRARGHALVTAGVIALESGDPARARQRFDEALTLIDPVVDPDCVAWARTGLGAAVSATGDLRGAADLQEQALETFRGEGDLLGQCTANTRIATLALARGDYKEAEVRFKGSLEVRRQIRDLWGTSYVLTELGHLRLLAGDVTAARAAFDEALDLVRRIDYRDGMASVVDGLGMIDATQQHWDEAATKFREASRLYWSVGNRAGRARALAHLARAELARGDVDAAAEDALAAFALGEQTGDSRALATALGTTGSVLAARGSVRDAAVLWGAARGVRDRHTVAVPDNDPMGPDVAAARDVLDGAALDALMEQGRTMDPEDIRARMAAAEQELRLLSPGA